ncbi:acetate--CoA ligase family protein [Nocardia vinacea]|uniref:Acetate--CoA ligase family protein n=1 Tax=Nocardia vinacea TaxID=96468 RepID=A0ABZ1YUP6_9NOCA|nr:acetate--CoA ligase family protein [Nocardia vinacea]
MTRTRTPLAGAELSAALFAPRSVALVGASADPAKASSRPLRFLRRNGFGGRVYPINSRENEIGGERAYRSLGDLPEAPDHAFVMTPTAAVVDVVRECGELGVPVVTVLSSGFAESGPEGAARQRELTGTASAAGVRLLGPNSLGLADIRTGLRLTANAAFAESDLPAGNIAVASHSGSMLGALLSRGAARGIGFGRMVSVGSEADLSVGEICSALLDDPDTGGFLLFLESLRHADRLREFAVQAAAHGKPVLAYKLGRSRIAADLALSHTGSLAGADDVAAAFFADCGIARAHTLDGLLEGLPLLERVPITDAPRNDFRVGVVTTTGGGAAMLVDQLGVLGVPVIGPSPNLVERLRAAGAPVTPGAIVDLTLAGTRYPVMSAALDVLLESGEFDLLVAVVGSSARFEPEQAVRPIIERADSSSSRRAFDRDLHGERDTGTTEFRPTTRRNDGDWPRRTGGNEPRRNDGNAATALAAFVVPEAPHAIESLTRAGVPAFRTPESCADAIAAAVGRGLPRALPGVRTGVSRPVRQLDEAASYAVLAVHGVVAAGHRVVAVNADATEALAGLRFPVAVKALSADLGHKSDAGGVRLRLQNPAEVSAAARTIRTDVAAHDGPDITDVLVQEMETGLAEVLVGYRVDPEAGPLVLVALGGVFAEVYADRSLRPAPVDRQTALRMLDEVTGLATVRGLRGATPGDLGALADLVVTMSTLADCADIAEAELNPLLVRAAGEGVVAIDAVVRLYTGTTKENAQ